MKTDENYANGLYYLQQSDIAQIELSKIHKMEIQHVNIQIALGEVLRIDPMMTHAILNDKRFSAEQIVDMLRDYDFSELQPEILASIEIEESIIPDGVERLLTEEKRKQSNEIWYLHKSDHDKFPLVHAHNKETGLKLDLINGGMYKKKKLIKTLSCKRLREIRDLFINIDLPPIGARCTKKTRIHP